MEVDVELAFDLLAEEFLFLFVAHGFDHVVFDFVKVQGAAVVLVQLVKHGARSEFKHRLLVFKQQLQGVLVEVAKECRVAGHPVQAVGRTAAAEQQDRHDDAELTAEHYANSVTPDSAAINTCKVYDHHATERAQGCADQVRVCIALACEHVCVVGSRKKHEPFIQEGSPEEQTHIVDEAEDNHSEETYEHRGHRNVLAVEPVSELSSGPNLVALQLP